MNATKPFRIIDTGIREGRAQIAFDQAMIDAIQEVTRVNSDAVGRCCTPDQDIAAKLNEQIERNRKALIANLSSFR